MKICVFDAGSINHLAARLDKARADISVVARGKHLAAIRKKGLVAHTSGGANGIPWWYFYEHGGNFDGRAIPALDPDDVLRSEIGLDRTIGTPTLDLQTAFAKLHLRAARLATESDLQNSESADVVPANRRH